MIGDGWRGELHGIGIPACAQICVSSSTCADHMPVCV